MILLVVTLTSLLACSLGFAENSRDFAELLVEVDSVEFSAWTPSGDSVVIEVYVENTNQAIGGLDLWLGLDHTELLQWDTVASVIVEGTATEDWELIEVDVFPPQFMVMQVLGIANTGGGTPPIPAGQGEHLLIKLIACVREDRLDPDRTVADSLCDPLYYEFFGETPTYILGSTKFSNEDGSGLIGWVWDLFCVDSVCVEWIDDSCVAWECTEWDSSYIVQDGAIEFIDGLITLDCLCSALIGDANDDGLAADIDDVVYTIEFIFGSGPAPVPYSIASGDSDCSCECDIDDASYEIAFIFLGGPPPCTCEEWVDSCGGLR